MVFKLQLYESVVGKVWRKNMEILGGCTSPFKLWKLYVSYPWSVYAAKVTSCNHILHVLRVRRNKQSLN